MIVSRKTLILFLFVAPFQNSKIKLRFIYIIFRNCFVFVKQLKRNLVLNICFYIYLVKYVIWARKQNNYFIV